MLYGDVILNNIRTFVLPQTSPKHKSPKIYKMTKTVTDAGGNSKKIGSSGKLKMSTQSTKKRTASLPF